MGNVFSKFFMSFGFKKNKYLPAGNVEDATISMANSAQIETSYTANATYKSFKPLATFDLNIEKPRYEGAIPEATIKFYPLD